MDAVYEQHSEFRGYFKAVIVGEMVENAKPAPDCFLLGAKLLDIDIKNCYILRIPSMDSKPLSLRVDMLLRYPQPILKACSAMQN